MRTLSLSIQLHHAFGRVRVVFEADIHSLAPQPTKEASRAKFSDVGVPGLIRRILHGFVERHELVASGLKALEHLIKAIGVDVIGVNQKRLRDLPAEDLRGYSLSKLRLCDCEVQVLRAQPRGKLLIVSV